jgi:hypothetical protein
LILVKKLVNAPEYKWKEMGLASWFDKPRSVAAFSDCVFRRALLERKGGGGQEQADKVAPGYIEMNKLERGIHDDVWAGRIFFIKFYGQVSDLLSGLRSDLMLAVYSVLTILMFHNSRSGLIIMCVAWWAING